MEAINTLSVWLEEAGLDKSAIAQWKFNALAKKFPDLADIIEDAKRLIGSSVTVPEVGMTVSEMASRLTSSLGCLIKPAQVNEALVELGFQVRPDNGKRIWQLTELGKEYGFSRLATSKTNDWSGPQVTWLEAAIPILSDYFESTVDSSGEAQATHPSVDKHSGCRGWSCQQFSTLCFPSGASAGIRTGIKKLDGTRAHQKQQKEGDSFPKVAH
jgi:hypothetical protein